MRASLRENRIYVYRCIPNIIMYLFIVAMFMYINCIYVLVYPYNYWPVPGNECSQKSRRYGEPHSFEVLLVNHAQGR